MSLRLPCASAADPTAALPRSAAHGVNHGWLRCIPFEMQMCKHNTNRSRKCDALTLAWPRPLDPFNEKLVERTLRPRVVPSAELEWVQPTRRGRGRGLRMPRPIVAPLVSPTSRGQPACSSERTTRLVDAHEQVAPLPGGRECWGNLACPHAACTPRPLCC